MKIKRKIIKLLSTAFIISMMGSMLTGCSSSTADTSNILNFGCTNFSDSLDPAAMPNAAWCVSRYGIGEALFRFDDQMEADYYLCDDYSVNDDNTEWTFHIRDGVKFSNGKELTASAVVESIEYMYKQENSGKGSSAPSVYMKYDSIKADDESRTVTIKTSKPHTDLTKTLAHPYFSILDMESDLVNKPVGTGPYAIDKYDNMKAVKFETYASLRIRGAILDQIRKMDWIPRTIRQKQKKIDAAMKAIEAEKGRAATDEEIAGELGISADEYTGWQSQMKITGVVSLDEFLEGGSEVPSLQSTQHRYDEPEDVIEKDELKKKLAEALELLTEKEKKVILLYYYEDLTLKEISNILSVSESRISQLHTRALQKMKAKMGNYMGIFSR